MLAMLCHALPWPVMSCHAPVMHSKHENTVRCCMSGTYAVESAVQSGLPEKKDDPTITHAPCVMQIGSKTRWTLSQVSCPAVLHHAHAGSNIPRAANPHGTAPGDDPLRGSDRMPQACCQDGVWMINH